MSGPLITNTSFAMASQTAAMARMAPATMAIPLPMKSLVTVALDMMCLPFESIVVVWIGWTGGSDGDDDRPPGVSRRDVTDRLRRSRSAGRSGR